MTDGGGDPPREIVEIEQGTSNAGPARKRFNAASEHFDLWCTGIQNRVGFNPLPPPAFDDQEGEGGETDSDSKEPTTEYAKLD